MGREALFFSFAGLLAFYSAKALRYAALGRGTLGPKCPKPRGFDSPDPKTTRGVPRDPPPLRYVSHRLFFSTFDKGKIAPFCMEYLLECLSFEGRWARSVSLKDMFCAAVANCMKCRCTHHATSSVSYAASFSSRRSHDWIALRSNATTISPKARFHPAKKDFTSRREISPRPRAGISPAVRQYPVAISRETGK